MTQYEPKELAEACADFVKSEFGEFLMFQLGLQYNGLHQSAEASDLTVEQKAMKIERAAGLKLAMDFVTSRAELHKQGYHREAESS